MTKMLKENYNPRYDMYHTHKMRLHSFNYYWATTDSQKRLVMEMVDAGLFYCGNGINDRTVCFSCGGVIEDWETYDDPWMQHAINFPHCVYLNAVKGRDYINKCLNQKSKCYKL